ncbi:hypothetical protein CEXT_352681 [Caerostris extrusa]|uniref:Dolichol phosphate-mannose biosynthesis regulatory protein n=1 Tax=Caerostris extrusa TaxID=172846 RepID=A0AAV4UTG1_CAEEX|nr:hypothetical protein CEXT_352681 [Caerostris extrusa]
MSSKVGCLLVTTGVVLFVILSTKLLVQPFIPENYFLHEYFPSTELFLGVPIFFGVLFFCGFGFYIFKEILKENEFFSKIW